MPAQRVQLLYPKEAPLQDFYCPACGTVILKSNDRMVSAACDHVDYLFIEETGEFEYLRPELREWLQGQGIATVGIDPADGEDIIDKLVALKRDATAAVFYVTTIGMSCCRSVAVTVVIGLDFYRA
jgi:hypothetical protein